MDMIWRVLFSLGLVLLAVSCSSQLPATPTDIPTPIPFTPTASPTHAPTNIPIVPTRLPAATTVARTPASAATSLPTESPRASQLTITFADNGKTIALPMGSRFLLDLGAEFVWEAAVDNASVLSAVPNTARNGNQGLYEARQRGNAELTAIGNPKCYYAVPRCLMPSLLFQVRVVVASGAPAAGTSVTPADNGKTITLQTGQTFVLNLGREFKWMVDVADAGILSRVASASAPEGAQGIYKANKPGRTTLSATGPFNCPPDKACIMIVGEFQVEVVVR
ncbi:MAG: hypothetical protein HY782_10790 [Chloroflexi bacterium]|nr:hypothetical protein [Chloroflexota bacterium]